MLAFQPPGAGGNLGTAPGWSDNFDIYWPPEDSEKAMLLSEKPLLKGVLALVEERQPSGAAGIRLVVTLTKPSDETDRNHWNSTLAFADIAWMEEVRVWDAEHQWLWPNLPFLLNLGSEAGPASGQVKVWLCFTLPCIIREVHVSASNPQDVLAWDQVLEQT